MKKRTFLPVALAALMLLAGCSTEGASSSDSPNLSSSGTDSTLQTSVDLSGMFTDRDMEVGYDEETSAVIELLGDSAS